MTGRPVSAEETQALLEGTTEGPWQFHAPEGESSAWVTQARDRDGVPLAVLDGVIDANGRLMAASWDLAHTVISLHAEIARLREELTSAMPESKPLSWGDASWRASEPNDVRIVLREETGVRRVAVIPIEKAEIIAGIAKVATDQRKAARRAAKGGAR